MHPYQTCRPRAAAFTLIELLTVIAIIGILAAIIIPTVGKVRQTARWAQGSSNIRSITLASLAYAQDNKGSLPWRQNSSSNSQPDMWWWRSISKYLNNDSSLAATENHPVFTDPLVNVTGTGRIYHFAPLGNFTINETGSSGNAFLKYRRLDTHRSPTQQVYFTDTYPGVDGTGGTAAIAQLGAEGYLARGSTAPDDPLDSSAIQLDTPTAGYIRWTDGKAKFGFMDGHVQVLKPTELKKRNMNPYNQ